MMTDIGCVFVGSSDCACHSVRTLRAHHHDFPEIWTQGGTPHEAASMLANQLIRALESAVGHHHRDPLERALADVQVYLESLEPPVPEGSAVCHDPQCQEGATSPSYDPTD